MTVIDRSFPSSVLKQASACGVRPLPHAEVHDLRIGCKLMRFTLSVGEAQMHRFTDGGKLSSAARSVVKAGRRPPPQAARSGLDGASTVLPLRSGR